MEAFILDAFFVDFGSRNASKLAPRSVQKRIWVTSRFKYNFWLRLVPGEVEVAAPKWPLEEGDMREPKEGETVTRLLNP